MDANETGNGVITPTLKPSTPFIPESWQHHLDLIQHLCLYSQNILMVLGPKGMGKTTLVKNFLDKADDGLNKIYQVANPDIAPESLLKSISEAFHQDFLAESASEPANANSSEGVWALIIDDADQLTEAQLIALLRLVDFEQPPAKQLHLILCGLPALEMNLLSPQLRRYTQGKVHTIEVAAWTASEWTSFAKQVDETITPQAAQTLIDKHEGHTADIIAAIKTPADAVKPAKKQAAEPPHTIEGKLPMKQLLSSPVALGAIAGITVGAAFLGVNHLTSDTSGPEPVALEDTADIFQPGTLLGADEESHDDAFQARIDALREQVAGTQEVTAAKTTPALPVTQPVKAAPKIAPVEQTIQVTDTKQARPKVATQSVEKSSGLAKPKLSENAPRPSDVQNKIAVKPRQSAASAPVKVPTQPKSINNLGSGSAKVEAKTPPTPKHKIDLAKQVINRAEQEQSLLARSGNHYTLQLLGAGNEKNVVAFIERNNLKSKAQYFKTIRNGKAWYVVVMGDYPSIKAAEAAELPVSLKGKVKPWARRMEFIQKDIQKGQA